MHFEAQPLNPGCNFSRVCSEFHRNLNLDAATISLLISNIQIPKFQALESNPDITPDHALTIML